jgi:hypothetical protein
MHGCAVVLAYRKLARTPTPIQGSDCTRASWTRPYKAINEGTNHQTRRWLHSYLHPLAGPADNCPPLHLLYIYVGNLQERTPWDLRRRNPASLTEAETETVSTCSPIT